MAQTIFYLYLTVQNIGQLHQELNHKPAAHQPASRAAAEHTGSSKTAASFPATNPIQCYRENTYSNVEYRFSEDTRMAVEKNGAQLFLAEHGVKVGEEVLKEVFRDEEDRIFKIKEPYIKDCGRYAKDLMFKMSGIKENDSFKRTITNVTGNQNTMDPKQLYNSVQVTSSANPDVGEAFYVLNDPLDKMYGVNGLGGHFNFHWGAVVAKSGSDVITAEADSNASDMWFQMYNTGNFNQSFKDNWYTKDKLASTAKQLQVKFSHDKKENVEIVEIDD